MCVQVFVLDRCSVGGENTMEVGMLNNIKRVKKMIDTKIKERNTKMKVQKRIIQTQCGSFYNQNPNTYRPNWN